jgi:hypothetical protein
MSESSDVTEDELEGQLQQLIEDDTLLRLGANDKMVLGGFITAVISTIITYYQPFLIKTPYHTSMLSGVAWVDELMNGHPERIRCELGVHLHVFKKMLAVLQKIGFQDSKGVTLREQLAIFLYTCVTGLSTRHVGERFQRSNTTVSLCDSSYSFIQMF